MEFCVIFVTAANVKEAKKLSQALLKERLAACVNRIDKSESSYWWKGKIETATECLLLIKSEKKLVKPLIKRVKELHSYTVPEIIVCPIVEGNPDYLNWIRETLK